MLRNYQDAVKALGGKVFYEGASDGQTTLRIAKNGAEFWVTVSEYGGAVTLWIMERKAMEQEVVANWSLLKSLYGYTSGEARPRGIG